MTLHDTTSMVGQGPLHTYTARVHIYLRYLPSGGLAGACRSGPPGSTLRHFEAVVAELSTASGTPTPGAKPPCSTRHALRTWKLFATAAECWKWMGWWWHNENKHRDADVGEWWMRMMIGDDGDDATDDDEGGDDDDCWWCLTSRTRDALSICDWFPHQSAHLPANASARRNGAWSNPRCSHCPTSWAGPEWPKKWSESLN